MNNLNYKIQLGYYDVYKTKQADIVMLGNSLTQGASWNELLDRPNVVGRGIPSDIIEGFIYRMEYIYKLKPKICFIMGGVNDIYSWIPVETIFQNYIDVINGLKVKNIHVVIQSTLHTGPDWGRAWIEANNPELNVREYNAERNKQISKLNRMLSNYAKQHKIDFIDLNEEMSSFNFLKSHLTWDGTHLNGKGYKIWSEAVDKILKKYSL
ncbi:GDSL-type esterase/lipase family protein [Bacteroidota bacterium]